MPCCLAHFVMARTMNSTCGEFGVCISHATIERRVAGGSMPATMSWNAPMQAPRLASHASGVGSSRSRVVNAWAATTKCPMRYASFAMSVRRLKASPPEDSVRR
eukprot:Amastigsp_a340137_5.p3 type:complete len:104 gc:universal Amastigsp_a340137_5:100-411(+)